MCVTLGEIFAMFGDGTVSSCPYLTLTFLPRKAIMERRVESSNRINIITVRFIFLTFIFDRRLCKLVSEPNAFTNTAYILQNSMKNRDGERIIIYNSFARFRNLICEDVVINVFGLEKDLVILSTHFSIRIFVQLGFTRQK